MKQQRPKKVLAGKNNSISGVTKPFIKTMQTTMYIPIDTDPPMAIATRISLSKNLAIHLGLAIYKLVDVNKASN